MYRTATLIALVLLAQLGTAAAAVKTETVEYRDGDTALKGYLMYDDGQTHKRPAVIVIHEWWGLNDYARRRAHMLAEAGYVAFAIDMYGDNRVTEHASEAGGWMKQITEHTEDWQRRALVSLDVLKGHPMVDAERIAAIGYCFGGATVMQMAYAGADLDGVVSFHGALPPATPEQQKQIKAKVLVAHGDEDGFVPAERIAAFQDALAAAGADWQMVSYGGAKHGFTNPDAGKYGLGGLAYQEAADRRSWALMHTFLDEIFAR